MTSSYPNWGLAVLCVDPCRYLLTAEIPFFSPLAVKNVKPLQFDSPDGTDLRPPNRTPCTAQPPLQSGACHTCCNCNFHLHLHPITKSRGDRHGTNGLRDCTATLRSLIQFRGGETFLCPAVTGPAGAFTVAATIGIKSRRPSGALYPRPPARPTLVS